MVTLEPSKLSSPVRVWLPAQIIEDYEMFDFLKKLFRKKEVVEVKKVPPVLRETPKSFRGLPLPRKNYTSATPAYYPPSSVIYDTPEIQKSSTPVSDSIDSFLMGMVTGAAVDEVVHAVSKSVETSHSAPPEPVHVTPSSSSSDYTSSASSPSSDSYSSPSYSSSSRSDSYSSSSSSDYSSSSSSDYSSSSSDSGSSWSD